jgi:hypothetical protein
MRLLVMPSYDRFADGLCHLARHHGVYNLKICTSYRIFSNDCSAQKQKLISIHDGNSC